MTYPHPSSEPLSIRRTGTVKMWLQDKGYGFIIPEEKGVNAGSDVFAHVSQTGGQPLAKGARVTFELSMDKKTGKFAARRVEAC